MSPPNIKIHNTVRMGQCTVIGEDGFGYDRHGDGTLHLQEHEFGVRLEENVSIGSHCSVDRGRWRDTSVKSGTKIDDHVHISHNVIIGKNCIIGAHTTILGSVEIGDNSEIWSNAVIHQGVKIGKGCAVGANTYLRHDLLDGMCAYISDKTGILVVKPISQTKKYGKEKYSYQN